MNVGAIIKNKTVRMVAIGIAALVLLLLVWAVFSPKKQDAYTPTEREAKLKVLLEELDGIESATVMITESGGEPVGAVIVFEGEDGILIRTKLMQIAASALSLRTKDIVVCPAS